MSPQQTIAHSRQAQRRWHGLRLKPEARSSREVLPDAAIVVVKRRYGKLRFYRVRVTALFRRCNYDLIPEETPYASDIQARACDPAHVLVVSTGREAERSAWQEHGRGWNRSHAKLTDWGLQQVILPKNAVMLDVGCGGGRTVSRLSALAPAGRVVGLDVSAASAVVAQDTNVGGIESGRVQILQGSVAALPFPSGVFDIVTAVETHYYWPNLATNVKEILRVLKPGGTFALIAEAYRGGPLRLIYGIIMPLIRAAFLSDAEHPTVWSDTGYPRLANAPTIRMVLIGELKNLGDLGRQPQ